MEGSGSESRSREAERAHEERKTWVARYLGEGWTEIEPGIYQHDGAAKPTPDTPPSDPVAAPEENLNDALDPAKAPEPVPHRSSRWRLRR